jgi:alpha-L-fucosidase
MKKYFTYFLLAALLLPMLASVQKASAQYVIPPKMQWWYDARFGMFIHFGSYSYLGHGEWAYSIEKHWTKSSYQTEVSAKFNPVNFNADTIASLAKRAGMKYIVITAKHHEGFSMWKTNVQSFKDVTGKTMYDLPDFTSFKTRDILKELKDACEARGIKFCLYYSIMDWSHSSQNINRTTYYSDMISDSARTSYIKDMKAQLKELITRYHPAVMWFDGDWTYNAGKPTLSKWWTKSDGIDLYHYLMGLDPKLIVNERVARSFGLGDFECPEQKIPESPLDRPWETCQTMNHSWGYNASDNQYKSPKTLIHELVEVVSRDGNYLLNIGPKGDGTLTEQTERTLNGMGDWMSLNSESIYGTTRSPYSTEPAWGFYTKKSGKLYAHVFTWPENKVLKVPALKNNIEKVYLLEKPSDHLKFTKDKDSIAISLPVDAPDTINSVVVINVTGMPESAVKGFTPTTINPYIQINGGSWEPQNTISANAGSKIVLGPQPANGGSWSWTGPDGSGFNATTREITLTDIKVSQAGNYNATFTNAGGCKSKATFSITVK